MGEGANCCKKAVGEGANCYRTAEGDDAGGAHELLGDFSGKHVGVNEVRLVEDGTHSRVISATRVYRKTAGEGL